MPESPATATFAHRLRVRYAECDPFRVAHHSSYVPWLEEARTEMLRQFGISYADMEAAGAFLVITKLEIKYRRPIRYDDIIEVAVSAQPAGAIRIRHSYEVRLVERMGKAPDTSDPSVPADGVCAVATTELASVNEEGRPQPLPDLLKSPKPSA